MSQKVFIPLEDVRVASPCHASWDMMDGNDRSKFCGSCRKNVYNLSEMTRQEAEALIAEKEGHLCVRYYQRADGTVVTQDCPVGLAMMRRAVFAPIKYVATGAAFLVAYAACIFGYRASVRRAGSTLPLRDVRTFKFLTRSASPTPTPPQVMLMGLVAPSRPVPTPIPHIAPTPAYTEVMGDIAMPDLQNPSEAPKTQE